MRPPCEIVQRDFLRAVRSYVARSLSENGYSQTEIATQMNMTQAAVSKYLSQPVAKTRLSGELETLTEKLTTMITSGDVESDALVREICSTCMRSRIGSSLCEMHQSKVPSLKSANCQICSQLLGGSDIDLSRRTIVIGDILEALKIIEASDSFVNIVPQIRTNIVACDESAKSSKEVAAVPGRITVIDGRARALVSPQFGASGHTAELLIQSKELWKTIRSCLYVSGDEEVTKAAKNNGFRVVHLRESESTPHMIIDNLKASDKIPGPRTTYPAIHSPGGFGVEPILYLFGPDAKQLSEKCIQVSDSLQK